MPTNIGIGRNPDGLLRVSEASGVNILMGAGARAPTHRLPDSDAHDALGWAGPGATLDKLKTYGGVGYANVIENFLPMLRERGVCEEDIHQMTVVNPGEAFQFSRTGV